MRVTQSMLNTNMLRNLNKSMRGMDRYQEMLASGKKVNKPSDDPVSAVRSMYHRTSITEIEQFQRNTTEALNWMELTDQTLDSAVNVLQRARELLVRGATDTMDDASKHAIAQELRQLKDQLGTLANTTIGGRYIFAGTDTKTAPYNNAVVVPPGDPLYSKIPGSFTNENLAEIKIEMGKEIFLPVNMPGVILFGDSSVPGDDRESIFRVLDDIVLALEGDSNEDISGFISNLEQNLDHIISKRSELGAKINRIQLVQHRLVDSHYSSTQLLSDAEDADIPKVITNLKNQENVHRAALSTGARIIQPSLMDFLR
ncbi:hypothetical protein BHU72_00160 [Desulfuribacillus stibiiarsenatis]|uniref:Flagellin N-terminal domain-containing protein n=1 Tax=Desulfuribacillus stibiiarsenatis TaxID=1390249 RepID=A0A1E5L9C6_9FIRM|nr:flagellar hook-associated protein FlgL [Desulfuribacillus stibiiarsenatis]OEH86726.1 hypothetical protein BHU72_00160 [Desulfuribacillus stibiiarsenatis]